MTVNTKKAEGRRELHYASYDELLADAEQLATSDSTTIGNWSLGQIFKHLAMSMDSSIDGTDMNFPWILRKFFGLIMSKEKMLKKPLPAGFKIPKQGAAQFSPDSAISTEEGLASLRHSIERCKNETSRAEHLMFGNLTREEWDAFNLRHAELHMSFVAPT